MNEEKGDAKKNALSILFTVAIIGGIILWTLIDEGIISLEPPEYPKKITQEQLHSLRLTSVISNWCLPDSINHYIDSIILKSASAILFKYDYNAKFLMDNVKSRLQQMGFVITDYGSKKVNYYDFYWLSAENGDIFTHVTSICTGKMTFISVASGKDVKEVLSIRIVTDGNSAELESRYVYNPTNPNILLTAPLAGTVYAIYHTTNPLCGNPNDAINVMARSSFKDVMQRTNASSPKLDLIWACDGYYKLSRLTPTHAFMLRPRGVAYAKVVLTGFGIK
jgi:hypothetical protein